MKAKEVTYRQQAQPRQFESLAVEVTVALDEGEILEDAAAQLGARVRRILAAQLELARHREESWLIGDDEAEDSPV